MELAWFKDRYLCTLSHPEFWINEERKQTKVNNSLLKILPGNEGAAK